MQGDAAMADIATAMGAVIAIDGDDVVIRRDKDELLKPLVMNMQDCSDLVPAVVVACSVASGVSEISGVGFIRKKESDRLGDLSNELVKADASIRVDADGLTITGVERLVPAVFDTHHDHRLAMALSLVSLVAKSVEVNDEEVVSKSWPHYFTDMTSILG
jgi:3-phosphoshikimate 1-carboxyvinyltransferase